MKKRVFSREFKLEVVRQWVSGEKRLAQLCREHGLCETVVRRWREQYEQDGERAFRTGHTADPEACDDKGRLAMLEAALVRVTLENQFLRHALDTLRKGGLTRSKNGR
jgi:transposase-like protein